MATTGDIGTESELDGLFARAVPMLDVRAPGEFRSGAFPASFNAPLLDDEERHKVGKCYREQGQDAAIRLGQRLVSGDRREQKMSSWMAFVQANPDAVLYCFRGGLRSRTVQQWLADAGLGIPLVQGGYKQLRQHLISATERVCRERDAYIVGGRTGAGKTRVIQALDAAIDLEQRANHRGSAFGRWIDPQPTQINFENALAVDLIRLAHSQYRSVVFEDESSNVGSVSVPVPVVEKIATAPLVLIEATLDERVDETVRGYINETLAAWIVRHGYGDGFEGFGAALAASLERIRRRLGGARYAALSQRLSDALQQHKKTGDVTAHRPWIRELLQGYYDPMYEYQLKKKANPVAFTGKLPEVLAWLKEQT